MKRVSGPGVRKALFAARAGFGVSALVAPRLVVRLLGLRPEDNADYAYILRIWGTREAFVALMSAGAGGTSTSTVTALRLGMVVDSVDMVSLWLAHRSGRVHPAALAFLGGAGAAAVGMGYLAATDAHRERA